jgi:hypothetical protein
MTKLLGLRTVYDIDPTKTLRIADILEDGAILPISVKIEDLMIAELTEEPEKHCCCYEFFGDNKDCPIQGEFMDYYGFAGGR